MKLRKWKLTVLKTLEGGPLLATNIHFGWRSWFTRRIYLNILEKEELITGYQKWVRRRCRGDQQFNIQLRREYLLTAKGRISVEQA